MAVNAPDLETESSLFSRPVLPTWVIGLGSVSALVLRQVCRRVGGRNAVTRLPLTLLHLDTSGIPKDIADELPAGSHVDLFAGNLTEIFETRTQRPELEGVWNGGYRPRASGQGAGGIPLHGLLRARLTTGLHNALQRSLDDLMRKAGRADVGDGHQSGQQPRLLIHIVGSLGGGTFSGAEHYLAALVNSVVRSRAVGKYTFDEVVFLPDLFRTGGREWFYSVAWGYLCRTRLLLRTPDADAARDPAGNPITYPPELSPVFLIGPSGSGVVLDPAGACAVVGDYLLARASAVGDRLVQHEDNIHPAPNQIFATPQFGVLTAPRALLAAAMAEIELPGVLERIVAAQPSRDQADQLVVQAFLEEGMSVGTGQHRGTVLAEQLHQAVLEGAAPAVPAPALGAGVSDVADYQRSMEQAIANRVDDLRQRAPALRARLLQAVQRVESAAARHPSDDLAVGALAELLSQGADGARRQVEALTRLPARREGAHRAWERTLGGRNLQSRHRALQLLLHAVGEDGQTRLRREAYRHVQLLLTEAAARASATRGQVRARAEALRGLVEQNRLRSAATAVAERLGRERAGSQLIRLGVTPEQVLQAADAAMPEGRPLPGPAAALTASAAGLLERVQDGLAGCPVDPAGSAVVERVHAALVRHVALPYVRRRKLVDWLLERPQSEWLGELRTLFTRLVHPLLAVNAAGLGAEGGLREIVVVGYAPPDDPEQARLLQEEIGNTHTQGSADEFEVYQDLTDEEILVAVGGTYIVDPAQIPNAAQMQQAYARQRARFAAAQGEAMEALEPSPDASGRLAALLAGDDQPSGGRG